MTASTKKRESVGIGKKGLESALDEAAAERRQRALVAQAEEDVGLRHAIEIRNLTAEDAEKFAPGVEQVAAEKLLSAAESAVLGTPSVDAQAPTAATQPRLARQAPPASSDDRATQPRSKARPAVGNGALAQSPDVEREEAHAPPPPAPNRGLLVLALAALVALFAALFVWLRATPDTPASSSASATTTPAGASAPTTAAATAMPSSSGRTSADANPSATQAPLSTATATPTPNTPRTASAPSAKPSAKPNVGSEWTDWKLDPAPKPK